MSTEAVEAQATRPWARRLATLHTRATNRGLRQEATPLAEITEDVLAVGVGMLQELAQQHVECARAAAAVNEARRCFVTAVSKGATHTDLKHRTRV